MNHLRKTLGFSLIELMITVAIVGILASVALPSYLEHIQKGRIVEATSVLGDMRINMEQYFQDKTTYVGACAAETVAPLPAATGHFTFACPAGDLTASTYTLQTSSNDGAYVFTLDQNNTKKTTKFAGETVDLNCWKLKKGDTC